MSSENRSETEPAGGTPVIIDEETRKELNEALDAMVVDFATGLLTLPELVDEACNLGVSAGARCAALQRIADRVSEYLDMKGAEKA